MPMYLEDRYQPPADNSSQELEPISPGIIRAQLAEDPAALEREVLDQQVRAGSAQFEETPYWNAGGAFGPKDLAHVIALGVGGLAGVAGAGAKGLAHYAVRSGAVEGMRPLAESMFAEAGKAAPSILSRLGVGALTGGAGAVGTTALASDALATIPEEHLVRLGTPEAQAEIVRRYETRGSDFAEKNKLVASPLSTVAPSSWDRSRVETDVGTLSVSEFKTKYGVLPEFALTLLENRTRRNPPGFFKRTMGIGK